MIDLQITTKPLSIKTKLIMMSEVWKFIATINKPEIITLLNKLNFRVTDVMFQLKEPTQ